MKIEQLKEQCLIKLDFSTQFYSRLQTLVLFLQQMFTPEELKTVYEKFTKNEQLDEKEEVMETSLILVQSLEQAAREQELVEIIEIPDAVTTTE